jgi:hypothetical protein
MSCINILFAQNTKNFNLKVPVINAFIPGFPSEFFPSKLFNKFLFGGEQFFQVFRIYSMNRSYHPP